MEKLIKKFEEWRDNIRYDVLNTDINEPEREKMKMQSSELSMAIGLLQGIGDNKNIAK